MSAGRAWAILAAVAMAMLAAYLKISSWFDQVNREAEAKAQRAKAQDAAVQAWERRTKALLEKSKPATLGDAIQLIGRTPDECRQFKMQFRDYTAHWSMESEGVEFGLVTLIVENCTPAGKVIWR